MFNNFKIRFVFIFLAIFMGLFLNSNINTLKANNIIVSNVTLLSGDTIMFDISWENSWRTTSVSGSTLNYDGAWVFVKFRSEYDKYIANPPDFSHMWLSTNPANHYVPSGVSLDVSTTDISGTPRGMGVFIYRDSDGGGNFSAQGIKLKWDKSAQGVTGNDWDFEVFAIEMIWVPQDNYYIGDAVSVNTFKDGSTTSPLLINSENALTLGTGAGELNQLASALSGTLPALFPKGYNGMWVMKYEISQEQYKDFLNTLSRANQDACTATNLASGVTSVTNVFVMSNTSSVSMRNGIRCNSAVHTSMNIFFYCSLNGDAVANEVNDGLTVACNYLEPYYRYYLDWAALRPISEMEFEKICRGYETSGSYVAYETVWGYNGTSSSNFTYVNNVSNSGYNYELPANTGNGLSHLGNNTPAGPRRVGSTHVLAVNRLTAGTSYYGAADMGGNLAEPVVKVADASSFSRNDLGDGELSTSFPSSWGVSNTTYRGGAWHETVYRAMISDRFYTVNTAPASQYVGARGGR